MAAVGFWASLAVREACRDQGHVELDLKWPNDLLWHGRKCVGILAQSRSLGGAARVVVGAGINVNRPQSVPEPLSATAAWLSDATATELDRTTLLARLLTIYERDFDRLMGEPKRIIEDWANVAALSGKQVSVKAVDGSLLHQGVVVDVAPDGALVLRAESGAVTRVTLGDVDVLS